MATAYAHPPRMSVSGYERARFVSDRFRRIWHTVELIAAEPGKSRRELADTFHLSERQVQADLNIIRGDLRLPLRRAGGYRFGHPGERPGATNLALVDALTLLALVTQARRSRSRLTLHLDALASRLPSMFPIHLQPVVRFILRSPVAAALVDAILNGEAVRLQYPEFAAPAPFGPVARPTIRPELLIPYGDSWYVIGQWRERSPRYVMVPVTDSLIVQAAP